MPSLYKYDAAGRRTEVLYPNGTKAVYTYDQADQVVGLKNIDKNGKVLSSFKYVYDASGQMIEETQTQQEEIYQRSYQYNKANEIIGFTEEHQGEITKYEYHYDGVGTRTGLTITGPEGTRNIQYTYNSANQLITETEGDKILHYEYDDNGNLIRKKGPGNQAEYYAYDEENRLVQIVEHQGKGQTFGYDSDGNRLFRTVSGNNGNGNGKGTPNLGIGNGKGQGYDNGKGHDKQKEKELNKPEAYEYIRYLNDISVPYPQVLMTADSKGTYRGVYTYGLERISVRDQVSVEGKPNNPLYYLYDARGSVSQLTNTNGNVRNQYRYEPFGAPMPGGELEPDTRLLNNPYGYNAEDYDIESNLQYLRARYYNPEIGRFISEDSYLGEIMQPLTLNRYAYTENNPLMYQDPSGHSIVKLGSRGQSVKELQQLLISSGYNGLKVDGIFGKDTLAAVKAYQTSKRLTVDGIVGSQTWGALRGRASTGSSSSNTYTSNPTLRKGSRGGAVTKLQQALMRLDYLGPYGADGVFGNQTEKAVKDFQRKNGLDPDGIVGKQTWAALAAKKVISNNRNDCGGSNKKRGNAVKNSGPTLNEAVEIEDHIYYEGSFKEARKITLIGGWKLDDVYEPGSLRIGVYARRGANGKTEYVLANRGTVDWAWNADLDDNLKQPFGNSDDMWNSLDYAEKFVKKHPNANITFVGHSKGGAEAAANAVKTNKNAILFNPATVNLKAYGLKKSEYDAEMTAYIVRGEVLNNLFGPISEPIGSMEYLPTQYPTNTWNPKTNAENAIENHKMHAVRAAIKQWQEGK